MDLPGITAGTRAAEAGPLVSSEGAPHPACGRLNQAPFPHPGSGRPVGRPAVWRQDRRPPIEGALPQGKCLQKTPPSQQERAALDEAPEAQSSPPAFLGLGCVPHELSPGRNLTSLSFQVSLLTNRVCADATGEDGGHTGAGRGRVQSDLGSPRKRRRGGQTRDPCGDRGRGPSDAATSRGSPRLSAASSPRTEPPCLSGFRPPDCEAVTYLPFRPPSL